MKKLLLIFTILFILLMPTTIYAQNNYVRESLTYNYSNIYKERVYSARDTIPVVNIDDITNWTNRKGFEVIHFLQAIIQPFAIIIFIISAFLLMIGSLGNAQMSGRGVCGMVTSVVVYSLVLYAPLFMSVFVGWLGN